MHAQLDFLLTPKDLRTPKVRRYEALRDGGGAWVEREALAFQSAGTHAAGDGIGFRASANGGWMEMEVTSLGFPADWRPYDELELDVSGDPSESVRVSFSIQGARCRSMRETVLAPGERQVIRVPFRDLPLGQGIQAAWSPSAIRLGARTSDSRKSEAEVLLSPPLPTTAEISLALHRISLREREPHRPPEPFVDGFGQRIRGEWPGKVHVEADLVALRKTEKQLPPLPGKEKMSRFGGFTDLPRHQGTGFFRVERDGEGRWWFIDPEGWRFWSMGVTGVRLLDTTVVEGRENWFEALPDREGPHARVWNPRVNSPANDPRGKETVSFYYWNVLRKYGAERAWRDHVLERFHAWGLNTLGNWSELEWFAGAGFPYTASLESSFGDLPMVSPKIPDVFDPRWEIAFRARVRERTAAVGDDPFLLGYFVDNEMGWGGLAGHLLRLPPASRAKQSFVDALRRIVPNLEEWNRESLRRDGAWEDLLEDRESGMPKSPRAKEWLHQGAGVYAEAYFSRVAAILKAEDPKHLYLGCRFVRHKPHAAICAAAGRHSDVVTVNCYDLWPREGEFSRWHLECGKPLLIGEHHLPLSSERQLPPLFPAFTAEERRTLYVDYVRNWAQQPWSLGCHWYQHADQPITGRPSDGENQPVGMVDITDTPHPELVEAVREASAGVLDWHRHAPVAETVLAGSGDA